MATRRIPTGIFLTFAFMLPLGSATAQNILDDLVAINEGNVERIACTPGPGDLLVDQVQQVGHSIACDCSDTCDGSCCSTPCPPPWWAHRTGLFGEFLYLRPGNTDIVYSVEQNDTTVNAFPTGQTGTAAVDMSPGFRVGFALANTHTTSLVASYTHWEGNTQDRIMRNNNNVLNSRIIHPSTFTTGGNSLQSTASTSMNFDLIDAMYRHKLFCTDTTIFNWSGGFRYGRMKQAMLAQQEISVATGLVTVNTEVDFNGFGFSTGLDAERRSCTSGMLCYTKGMASFLGGQWSGDYRQTNQVGGGVVANRYEDFRITPVLEAGLGVGWQSDSGCIRATIGYTAQCWCNALNTRDYVDGVRNGNFVNLDETISFIGLTSQLEVRF